MQLRHIPVLMQELEECICVKPGARVIDATLDGGGHTNMLLQKVGPSGCVLGIEQDPDMIRFIAARKRNDANLHKLIIADGNFRDIADIAKRHYCVPANAVLFDLGISRWHFLESGRGFSFTNADAPLSMDISNKDSYAAAKFINGASKQELEAILRKYGEMRGATAFAKRIIEARRKKPFRTVGDLLALVPARRGKINPATKIFQALRIAVNDELGALEDGLVGAWNVLSAGGQCAVISYHSLEDRIVKQFFKTKAQSCEGILATKKPIIPSREEILRNPSARSAKLRIIQKL